MFRSALRAAKTQTDAVSDELVAALIQVFDGLEDEDRMESALGDILDEELDAYRREGKDDDDDEELRAVPAAQGSVHRPAKCVYMTTGVLLQLLTHHRDDTAMNYTHILIDEAHERDVDMDLVLVTLRRMVIAGRTSQKKVPKVIIMSATVDAQRLCGFFGDRTPHLHVGIWRLARQSHSTVHCYQ